MYQNRLSLIGFSGKEAEQKFTNGGVAYTVLSLATKTSWKNDKDEWESRTEWHRIIAWSRLGPDHTGSGGSLASPVPMSDR